MCPYIVGKRVVKHCTVDQDYGECEECEPKTYSSEPNGEDFCLRCTSCTHPNGIDILGYHLFFLCQPERKCLVKISTGQGLADILDCQSRKRTGVKDLFKCPSKT